MSTREFLNNTSSYNKSVLQYIAHHKKEQIKTSTEALSIAYDIMKKKNADYSNNTSQPFLNFYACEKTAGVSAELGILIRLTDKASRISNLVSKFPSVKTESAKDTIIDSMNYLIILKNLSYDRARSSRWFRFKIKKQKKLGTMIDYAIGHLLEIYHKEKKHRVYQCCLADYTKNIKDLI